MSVASTTSVIDWVRLDANADPSASLAQRSFFSFWNATGGADVNGYVDHSTLNYDDFWLRIETHQIGLVVLADLITVKFMEFDTDICDYDTEWTPDAGTWGTVENIIVSVTDNHADPITPSDTTDIRWAHGVDLTDTDLCGGTYESGGIVTVYRTANDHLVPHPKRQGDPRPVTQGTPRPVTL
jgi:hypothetical protein